MYNSIQRAAFLMALASNSDRPLPSSNLLLDFGASNIAIGYAKLLTLPPSIQLSSVEVFFQFLTRWLAANFGSTVLEIILLALARS